MKWLLRFSAFVLCFFIAARFCKKQTDSFTVLRITSYLTPRAEWEIHPLPPEEKACLNQIFNRRFFYLGKGVQSFVFGSEDGRHVIKFFRHDRFRQGFWATKKLSTLHKDFASYKIAYEQFKDETGLIFLHLNKTTDLHQSVKIVDKLGIEHQIPLDKYEFLVQKRATLLYDTLGEMIQKKEIDKGRQTLSKLVELLALRIRRGIFDKDPDLNTNFGVIGTQPIQIDVGRFRQKPKVLDKNEIIRITDHLHQWLMVRCPELDDHLKEQIEKL